MKNTVVISKATDKEARDGQEDGQCVVSIGYKICYQSLRLECER